MSKSISISGQVPGNRSKKVEARRRNNVTLALGEDPLYPGFIKRGHGALIVDEDDNRLIDFTGGWGCLLVGHTPERVVSAIKDQAEKYLHTDFSAVPYEPYVELAERLADLAPGKEEKRVALFNSGAEAVENAVKIARGYTGRKAVVVFENAFHGRTLLTMTMTHQAKPYKYKFGPFAPDVYRLRYPDPFTTDYERIMNDFRRDFETTVLPEEVAALVIEPVQGEGGFRVPPDGFLELLREFTEEHGITFVVDEVQSGIGRTGKTFAIENWDVVPDLIAVGKSLAAGMPLSGVIGKESIMNSLPSGSIGGTYAGNPLGCRAAIEVLNIIEEQNLLDRAKEIEKVIRQELGDLQEDLDRFGDLRGIGAMMGMEFVKDSESKEPTPELTAEIADLCLEKGLLVPTCGINHNVIRLLLPLVITDEQLGEGLEILKGSIKEVAG